MKVDFSAILKPGMRVPFVSRKFRGLGEGWVHEYKGLYACDIVEARLSEWLLSEKGRRLVRHYAARCGNDLWRISMLRHIGWMLAVLLDRAGVPTGLYYILTCRRAGWCRLDEGLPELVLRVGREEGAPPPNPDRVGIPRRAWDAFMNDGPDRKGTGSVHVSVRKIIAVVGGNSTCVDEFDCDADMTIGELAARAGAGTGCKTHRVDVVLVSDA